MKQSIRLLASIVLLFSVAGITNGQPGIDKKSNPAKAGYVSLGGQAISAGNPVGDDGNIHRFIAPALHLMRAKSPSPKGTILLFPGGGYEILKLKNEGEKTAKFLNAQNFDVAILEYHIASGGESRDLALNDALQAFRLLKSNKKLLGLRGNRFGIMGISSGGHLAALTVQQLGEKEEPDDLVLISPAYLDETSKGTVFPAIMPPVQPTSRLFATFSAYDNKSWITSCQEYAKIWRGYDGYSAFNLLNDSTFVTDKDTDPLDSKLKLAGLLKTFLESTPGIAVSGPNPATIPVEGYAKKRHAEKLELISKGKFDLIMIGNSPTRC